MRRFDPKIIPPAHSNLPYEVVMVQSFDGDLVFHSDHAAELARVEKERDSYRDAFSTLVADMNEMCEPLNKILERFGGWDDSLDTYALHFERITTLLRAECEAWRACKGFTDERMFWAAAWTYEDGKAVIAARAATDAAGILKGAGT